MRQQVLVVIDIRLHDDAVDAVDVLGLALVKRELNVGLAELHLLPTAGGAGMKHRGGRFGRELLGTGLDDLIY